MNSGSAGGRWLGIFLWISVTAWAIGLGAKLFELVVLIPAWSAHPPDSFSLLPYGPRWPFNPGDFFQPLSALLVVGTVGALIAGWRSVRSYKRWLWLSVASLVLIWAATPTLFWPMIEALYFASTGAKPLGEVAATQLANQWILFDWIREALIAIGFVASVRAISTQSQAYGA